MKILVITPGYPVPNKTMGMYYIHSRNLYYIKHGFEVTVLNFGTPCDYDFDGIRVISLKTYKQEKKLYDLLISHASNIRNQYRFLKKYGHLFSKKVFIFHGGEILHINKYYPTPYAFKKKGKLFYLFQEIYDNFKIAVWKQYYLKNINDIRLVFVSDWLLKQFKIEFQVLDSDLMGNGVVISNSVGEFFSSHSYEPRNIEFDMIMIRGVLDESKYCVDLLCDLAKGNPDLRFCLIGNGEYFEHYTLPSNIEFHKTNLTHPEMKEFLDRSRCAFMPTREDTQGLMACEFATYGIPLITSDIEICREVFDTCENVILINNDRIDAKDLLSKVDTMHTASKWDKYLASNTIIKEINYLQEYVNKK